MRGPPGEEILTRSYEPPACDLWSFGVVVCLGAAGDGTCTEAPTGPKMCQDVLLVVGHLLRDFYGFLAVVLFLYFLIIYLFI